MVAKKRIVIIGAGFAGLYAAQTLGKAEEVEVVLIDRNNSHTFTPLLYQVATCALDPSSIAYPVRSIFRKSRNVQFMMGEVTEINWQEKYVTVKANGDEREEAYDYLLVAAGSVTNHFGQESIAQNSFNLKDLDDAVELRHHILRLFERAAWTKNSAEKDALTTLVVVGGGPTGIETAGAMYELYNHVLKHEYANHKPKMRARVILLEAMDHLLDPYPENLQRAATKQLEDIGVEVMFNAMVEHVAPNHVRLRDGRIIDTHTLVWAAGVKASPLVKMLDVEPQRQGRMATMTTMQVPERDGVYAAGDIVHLINPKDDKPYPMLIPVAKQQGILAAKNMLREMRNNEPLGEFHYRDRGTMATIGRSRAVAWLFNRIPVTGFIAWLSWLFLHLVVMMGFRNRLSVFINWIWNYITYDRSVRVIVAESGTEVRKPIVAENTQQPAQAAQMKAEVQEDNAPKAQENPKVA